MCCLSIEFYFIECWYEHNIYPLSCWCIQISTLYCPLMKSQGLGKQSESKSLKSWKNFKSDFFIVCRIFDRWSWNPVSNNRYLKLWSPAMLWTGRRNKTLYVSKISSQMNTNIVRTGCLIKIENLKIFKKVTFFCTKWHETWDFCMILANLLYSWELEFQTDL